LVEEMGRDWDRNRDRGGRREKEEYFMYIALRGCETVE
jgi:hypothetical protein